MHSGRTAPRSAPLVAPVVPGGALVALPPVAVDGVGGCDVAVPVEESVTTVVELPQPARARARNGAAQRAIVGNRGTTDIFGLTPGPPATICAMRLMRAIAAWDPFLAPQLVVAAALALDLLLPNKLTIGPAWLLPGFEGLLLVGLVLLSPHPRVRHWRYRRHAALALTALVSLANSVSLVLLCHYLLHGGKESGRTLIGSGMVLWVTNVLLFGVWYWQLDRGGPVARQASTAAAGRLHVPADDR